MSWNPVSKESEEEGEVQNTRAYVWERNLSLVARQRSPHALPSPTPTPATHQSNNVTLGALGVPDLNYTSGPLRMHFMHHQ